MAHDLSDLYQEQLMDHYQHPRHHGVIDQATFSTDVDNPSCGDAIAMTGIVDNGILIAVGFTGTGCVISQAAASMITDKALNQSVETIKGYSGDTMRELLGIDIGPTRLRCALLPLEALQAGLNQDAQ